MKNTKLNWKEEDNNYLNKVFEIANICYALVIILAPLITSVFCLIGLEMDILNVYLIFVVIYILTRILYYSINFRFIKFRKLDLLEILGLALLFTLFVSFFINKNYVLNINSCFATFIITISYFFMFLTFIRLDKKFNKLLLFSFIFTIVICSIMGLCDFSNSFMPGFNKNTYPMSMQFFNPNYSAYITVMAILLTVYVLHSHKKIWEQVVFWICYCVLNVALFINGCFSAETAMFVGELFLIIYLWIKNKKCPWIMLICLGISIGSSFVWIKGVSTSGANYMFEFLGVIDNKLGTSLVKDVSAFFDKIFHIGKIESVAGSDGWDREDLKLAAWNKITSNAKVFLFGGGSGLNYDIRVHNVYLQIWLEYGLFSLLLYLSILVVLIIRIYKSKFSSHNIFMIAVMIAVVFVCHYFGCLDPYSFAYYICLLAVGVKNVNEKYTENKKILLDKSQEITLGEDKGNGR